MVKVDLIDPVVHIYVSPYTLFVTLGGTLYSIPMLELKIMSHILDRKLTHSQWEVGLSTTLAT